MQRVLLEVNVAGEHSKAGICPGAAMELAHQMAELKNLKLCGLMAIPPAAEEPSDTTPYFEQLCQLFLDMQAKKLDNTDISVLSMGMSGDYREAIACGATMVRVGTAIFGPRPPRT